MKGQDEFLKSFQKQLPNEHFLVRQLNEKDFQDPRFLNRGKHDKHPVWYYQTKDVLIFAWFKDDQWLSEVIVTKKSTNKYTIVINVKRWILCSKSIQKTVEGVSLLKSCLLGFEKANQMIGDEHLKEMKGKTMQ